MVVSDPIGKLMTLGGVVLFCVVVWTCIQIGRAYAPQGDPNFVVVPLSLKTGRQCAVLVDGMNIRVDEESCKGLQGDDDQEFGVIDPWGLDKHYSARPDPLLNILSMIVPQLDPRCFSRDQRRKKANQESTTSSIAAFPLGNVSEAG